jgi:hypothetical protein
MCRTRHCLLYRLFIETKYGTISGQRSLASFYDLVCLLRPVCLIILIQSSKHLPIFVPRLDIYEWMTCWSLYMPFGSSELAIRTIVDHWVLCRFKKLKHLTGISYSASQLPTIVHQLSILNRSLVIIYTRRSLDSRSNPKLFLLHLSESES